MLVRIFLHSRIIAVIRWAYDLVHRLHSYRSLAEVIKHVYLNKAHNCEAHRRKGRKSITFQSIFVAVVAEYPSTYLLLVSTITTSWASFGGSAMCMVRRNYRQSNGWMLCSLIQPRLVRRLWLWYIENCHWFSSRFRYGHLERSQPASLYFSSYAPCWRGGGHCWQGRYIAPFTFAHKRLLSD